ncbi:MAG: hypothetical protein MK161_01220 [Pirellulales bacterium]|nr:hypothetical protein [Pirellulales bacterium]
MHAFRATLSSNFSKTTYLSPVTGDTTLRLQTLAGAGRWLCALLLVTILAIFLAGCSRTKYRLQADREVNCLVDHKAVAAGSAPGEFRININPTSRMYDPYNPDCEPMPPDDPISHRYMECVDCKPGSKCWKCAEKTPFVENPDWMQYLPLNKEGTLVLDQTGAVKMALLQSPRYQEELEDLYLSALDVTFERFRFDTQFFGGSGIFFTADGRDRSGTGSSSSILDVQPLRPSNQLRLEKLSATGGELVVGLANSLVWQFAGPDEYAGNTILDFAIVQPLLRFGGRTRVLERLTLSERTLLSNVRSMERYRRGFYLNIVTGESAGPGPSRRGGVFGASGLEGFSGVGGGGFGRLGGGGSFFSSGTGNGFTGGAGAAGAKGYLGLLQSAQEIQNQQANVVALRGSVEQLQASYEAGRIDRFQVDLARQALYNAQSQLLTSEAVYQTVLDNYKIDLGLPPDLPVAIRDPLLDQFQLIDADLDVVRSDVAQLLDVLRQPVENMNQVDAALDTSGGPVLLLPSPAEEVEDQSEEALPDMVEVFAQCRQIEVAFQKEWATVQDDFTRLQEQLPTRCKALQGLAERPEVQEALVNPSLLDISNVEKRVELLRNELADLDVHFSKLFRELNDLIAQTALPDAEKKERVVDILDDLSNRLLELGIAQARARLDAISFQPVDLTSEQALAIARVYRRDWANARAALVDTWRLIYFNANALLSDLNIFFSGDLGNVGDNPFHLRRTRGRLRVGMQIDPPLTRLAERNIYRQSLIEYQEARRNYYQFRDRIDQQLRNTIRQLRLNEVNLEIRRAAVLVAIAQVDLTQIRLSEPPKPGAEAELGATTARDLVQSLSDLLNVQNDFLSVWVNYRVQRLNLEYDLGVMQINPEGIYVKQDFPLRTFLDYCRKDPVVTEEEDLENLPPVEFLPDGPVLEFLPLPAEDTDSQKSVKFPGDRHNLPLVSLPDLDGPKLVGSSGEVDPIPVVEHSR